jgi:signal transduction histidine kinase
MLAGADRGGAKAQDYLTEINGAGARLLHLINDILEITQMDTDEGAQGELVYLLDLVESVMEKMRPEAEAAHVALQAAVSERLPALTGDGKRLKRALEHLVSNAIKFGAKGGFAVIGARLSDGGLVLEVSDNGVGLKSGTEAAAMALFAQADSSLARKYEGVGLGLTFVARVAHHHGAAMRIHSKPNEGTRVALVFPQSRIVQAREVA